ncbi:MAG: replication initiation protein, partial [Bacteroidetes bacterium]|nr:replication initiation protein [Bacteroidota bacterium]
MTQDERLEIEIKRNYPVFKSNELVQKSRYDLSVAEQRAVAYICSLIRPTIASPKTNGIPYQLEYEFDIWEYAKVCGLKSDGGMLYKETRAVLKRLILKIIEMELPDGDEVMMAWLVTAKLSQRSGKVKIKLNEDLAPYLFDLQEKFTAFGLLNILAMKSQYSIRIYEILKSYAYRKIITFDVDELKRLLMVDGAKGYKNFKDFRKRILEPAMSEINKYTDLSISYEQITKGRKVVKIKFLIAKKDM